MFEENENKSRSRISVIFMARDPRCDSFDEINAHSMRPTMDDMTRYTNARIILPNGDVLDLENTWVGEATPVMSYNGSPVPTVITMTKKFGYTGTITTILGEIPLTGEIVFNLTSDRRNCLQSDL